MESNIKMNKDNKTKDNKTKNNKTKDDKIKYIESLRRQNITLKKHSDTPKVDLLENNDNYVVILEIPGQISSCVEIQLIDNQNLFIFYDKFPKYIESQYKIKYREIRYGQIKRKVKLPSKVNDVYQRDNSEDSIICLTFDKKQLDLNDLHELSSKLEKLNWADVE